MHDGMQYQIVHNAAGYRCGYIRITDKAHPWFGKQDEIDCDVHGGLTFAHAGKACETHGEADEWWIGFDCGHAFDAIDMTLPMSEYVKIRAVDEELYNQVMGMLSHGVVRDTDYVRNECFRLIAQAKAAV
jgi:hypothetical protein